MATVAMVLAAGAGHALPPSIRYEVTTAWGARAHVVAVDLHDRGLWVTPRVAYGMPGRRQNFGGFLATYQPYAQLTGAYFGMQDGFPIGDIVVRGDLLFNGAVGSALCITPDNLARIVDVPRGAQRDWADCRSVLQGGIRLVRDGAYAVDPGAQGFGDPGLFRNAPRTAVGLCGPRQLRMVAVPDAVSLGGLAHMMLALGCTEAMTLDGGGSTGMAVDGRIVIAPGRPLSNVLVVVPKPDGLDLPTGNQYRVRKAPTALKAEILQALTEAGLWQAFREAPAYTPGTPLTAFLVNSQGFRYSNTRRVPARESAPPPPAVWSWEIARLAERWTAG